MRKHLIIMTDPEKNDPEKPPSGYHLVDNGENVQTPNHKNHSCFAGRLKALLVILCASTVAFQIGFTIGFSSTAKNSLENDKFLNMTNTTLSWFGSIITATALFGSLISVVMMKKLGKFPSILFCNLVFVVGWTLLATSFCHGQLFVGRALTGFSMGMGFAIIPLYIGEMSPVQIRGSLGSLFNIVVALGIPVVYALGYVFLWRDLAKFGAVFSAAGLLLCLVLPESPYWLAMNRKPTEAVKVFSTFADDANEETMTAIRKQVSELELMEQQGNSTSITQTFSKPWIYKPFLLVLVFATLQQLSGVNAVFYNIHFIFRAANFYDENLASILVGCVQLVTMICASFFMDKAGRRKMLLISSCGTCLCLVVLGFALSFAPAAESESSGAAAAASVALASTLMYIMFFAIGLGPIPFILIGEMMPMQINEFSGGVASVVNNLMSLVVIQSFYGMNVALRLHGVFWLYALFCGLAFFVTWRFLPEVKGKSILEIQSLFRPKNSVDVLDDDEKDEELKRSLSMAEVAM